MKVFGGLLVILIVMAVGHSQSIGLETYNIELEAGGIAPLLTCSSNNEIQGCIYSISTTNTKFMKYTLTNADFDSVPLNWTTVDAEYFPLCAEAADENDAFMFHFHEGKCELSLEYGYARDGEPSDLTDTKTVYIREDLPTDACLLADGSAIADGKCALVAVEGCTKIELLATCDASTATYDPDISSPQEYFDLEETCAYINDDCTSTCDTGFTLCYPSSSSAVSAFLDTLKGQVGDGGNIGVALAYDVSDYKWNEDFVQAATGSDWATGEPSDNKPGFVSADGLVDDDCAAPMRLCCMLE